MLAVRNLTKRYGDTTAVDGLTFDVQPGRVTGFLGPNGAGKSTTMRTILGLDRPTSGEALVNGRPYAQHSSPVREIGALLDARAVHPGRSAHAHLLAMARACGIPKARVADVLDLVGLAGAAGKRAGEFSLGMGQRLGIAEALMGDPGILVLDEPVNGLDLDGVRWVRDLMRDLADEGRTVFVSSHLMSELQIVADHLVIIGRGRLITEAPMADVIAAWSNTHVVVRTPDPGALAAHLKRADEPGRTVRIEHGDDGELLVYGLTAEDVGDIAYGAGTRVHGLRREEASLEQAYLEITETSVEYGARAGDQEKEHQ
ncbi:ABC-2 type transport system ATP-binding protein [Lipingzhangella halophila]|uniref:ABC-2 type transport system ATP-binding protein n=1 Tax=Lipingzhangella halophila TaxID=1783352 RepID=A0A7W7RNV5_9ACTN|nr:ATP-binding cassette domain-containing protein [Lipingzhangella halophila]MBB4934943.1 ABC-2 type transport system ATP-binding protein [Lipingzhangella halophila]